MAKWIASPSSWSKGKSSLASQLLRDDDGDCVRAFCAERVDIAVLEVGMGGRLDATNVVEPLVSVIADISLDHQKFLGNTVGEIAREKVGIIRPGGVVVTLPQQPEANDVIGNTILELGCAERECGAVCAAGVAWRWRVLWAGQRARSLPQRTQGIQRKARGGIPHSCIAIRCR
jgi:folylpolyglutamate synthase/dihydropteroate synthase